jgi:hypothetical protein
MLGKASLIENRKLLLASGAIVQIRIWLLPAATPERPHRLKYSLFYGRPGERIIGYDNETGKGDHRHYRDREEPYAFSNLERLVADFEADVRKEIENE